MSLAKPGASERGTPLDVYALHWKITIGIYIYIYIHIRVNSSDLTATSLTGIMVNKGNHPHVGLISGW